MYENNFLGDFLNKFNVEGGPNVYYKTYTISSPESKSTIDYELNIVKDGTYFIFEVPGFNKTNLEVSIEGSNLVINGTRKYKISGKEKEKKINEKVELTSNTSYDVSSIEASIEDGILTVFIPNYNQESVKKKNKITLL